MASSILFPQGSWVCLGVDMVCECIHMVCMPVCTQFVCACLRVQQCVSMSACGHGVRVRVSLYLSGLLHTQVGHLVLYSERI